MHREALPCLFVLLWLACLSPLRAAPGADALDAQSGEDVALPYTWQGRLDTASCVELRVLEQGGDVRVTLALEGQPERQGTDGNIARHGLHVLVDCSLSATPFRVQITAVSGAKVERARWSQRIWRVADGKAFFAMQVFAGALARYGDNAAAADVATQLARAGAFFTAAGLPEQAALAWLLATARAERAVDRTLATTAFEAAQIQVKRLGWTRHSIVLLNNRALFIAPADLREGLRLIEAAFAQQAVPGDPQLAAVVENNLCLLRYQSGALDQSEACFGQVLQRQLAQGANPTAIGATRNNLALTRLAQGHYREAEAGFRLAAETHRAAGSPRGLLEASCNIALALYQQGRTAAAIAQLLDAYALARDGNDAPGRAHAGGLLAGIYLAWGDSDTAWAYASEAEQIFRRAGQIGSLAPQLRLVARIAQARGDAALARATIAEAWELANANDLRQAAANIAPVHALIQIEQGDYAGAARFIETARQQLAGYASAADLVALRLVELRLLRETGEFARAARQAAILDRALPYPGLARSQLLIERHLVAAAEKSASARVGYTRLLATLRQSVVAAPDPELALRLQELARPAAEAAIARELADCSDASPCAAAALRQAQEFFLLEPGFSIDGKATDDRLPSLLQALSQLQSRDDTAAAAQLIRDIRRIQAQARQKNSPSAAPACAGCNAPVVRKADLVFFFGATRSWRWQRSGSNWQLHPLPGWRTFATHLAGVSGSSERQAALRGLAPLLAGLAPLQREEVLVGGDARLSRIPFAALPLDGGGTLLDAHAVAIVVPAASETAATGVGVAFLGGEGGGLALPTAARERTLVEAWAQQQGAPLHEPSDGRPLSLLHIVAHGQRDLGAGMAVLWLKDRPLLSYLSPGAYRARTVVINACDSGAAPEDAPVQASIAMAFLRNGASRVVATHFPVPDRMAADFARAFYAAYDPRQDNLVRAVGQAQRELRRQGRGTAWAGYFVLIADASEPTSMR